MRFIYESTKLKSKLVLSDTIHSEPEQLKDKTLYKFIWILSGTVELVINHQHHEFHAGQMIPLSYMRQVEFGIINGFYQALLFNDNFYDVCHNDSETGSERFLFDGSPDIAVLDVTEEADRQLKSLTGMMIEEFETVDIMQEKMLQLFLKRQIIICCRLAKHKHSVVPLQSLRYETMREFYALVDLHFKEKKQVQEYAKMLHKSPKTLASILAAYQQPPAIRIIHNRITSEAKRLLHYTSKPLKEIATILGFDNLAAFSRFFRHATGMTASQFRKEKE